MKLTKPILILFLILLFTTNLFSQDKLSVKIETKNLTEKIKDGIIIAKVTGGKTPYKYKWSNQSTSLDSAKAQNLTEGIKYNLQVIDANKDTLFQEIIIQSTSLNEKFNSALTPAVDFIGTFVMADIFALMQIYDPTMRDKSGEILRHPNGDPKKTKIPIIVLWLVVGAVFFTIRMGFINIRGIKHSLDLVRGKYDNPESKGEVSHFQALATALSATVGLGNIAGVAIAMSIGGPGATF